ncbi:NAD(P)-binding protein [Thozetella sp. PMI_491]|nr:NAD(P)-binding protein [Thozetella sp. PMI_491]
MASVEGTIVVTGANGGLGSSIVTHIVQRPELSSKYHGVFIVRNRDTATTLKGVLARAPTSFPHDAVSIDLTSLASVREGAKIINARVAEGSLPPIRALLISAGCQESTTQTFTTDGFDMTFQANYLSQFLLVLLLLQSLDKEHGRIVIVSGWNHDPADPRNQPGLFPGEEFKELFHDTESLAKGTWCNPKDDTSGVAGDRRYGAAHLCEVMFMHELQKRLSADPALSNIAVLGLDPGAMATDICRRHPFMIRVFAMKILMPMMGSIMVRFSPNGFMRTPYKSASDVLRAAFDTETLGEKPKGIYLNGSDVWATSEESRDEAKREALWKDSIRFAKITEGETVLKQWS